MSLKTIELFAGIGGFRLASDAHAFKTVWANDINELAGSVYRHRFGTDIFHLGDINQSFALIPDHDLLTGGFPCQPFSSAGKKMGINDPRGSLFESIIKILEEHHPKFFILENVKRLLTMEKGAHFATILDALSQLDYFIEWRLLNAMDFGLPQNRQRTIIVGTSKQLLQNIPTLKLATAQDLAELSAPAFRTLISNQEWKPIQMHDNRFPSWGVAYDGRFFSQNLDSFSEHVSPRLLKDVLEPDVGAEFDFTDSTVEWLHLNDEVNRFVQGVEILSNRNGGASMGYTIFGVNGIAPTLTATTSRHYERYKINGRYRRLTNIEYARIQGFPDRHCDCTPIYHQYALYGNAVPPAMVKWIMGRLEKGFSPTLSSKKYAQLDLLYDI
jgi:DNA (cytosine-5)-methyltransferase 1